MLILYHVNPILSSPCFVEDKSNIIDKEGRGRSPLGRGAPKKAHLAKKRGCLAALNS